MISAVDNLIFSNKNHNDLDNRKKRKKKIKISCLYFACLIKKELTIQRASESSVSD